MTSKTNVNEKLKSVKDEIEYLKNHLYDDDVTKEDIESYVGDIEDALESLKDEFDDLNSCLDEACDALESVYKDVYNLNE